MNEREIKVQLEDKLSDFVKELMKGKHIEIHLSRDGVKFFSVDKKVVK